MQQVCEISEILALNVCPNCGYLLDGLPREGNCPECGRTYGQTQVVLYGYGRGKHENSGTAKPSRLAWVLFVSTLVILFQQFWLVVNLGRRGIVILAIIALLPSAYLFIRRRSGSHPRPVQVRLDAKGCVQYDELAGPSPLRDLLRAHEYALALACVVLCILAALCHWLPAWVALIYGIACVFWVFFAWRRSRVFREAVRALSDNAVADFHGAFVPSTPWAQVKEFELTRCGSGQTYRIKIRGAYGTPEPVDAEVEFKSGQAEVLEKLVGKWWDEAKAIGDGVIASGSVRVS